MIRLVLNRSAEELVGFVSHEVALEVIRLKSDLPGTPHVDVNPGRLRQPSSSSTARCRLVITGLMKTCSLSAWAASAVRLSTKNRNGRATWLAARPIPLGRVQKLEHRSYGFPQAVVDFGHRSRNVAEDGMWIVNDLKHVEYPRESLLNHTNSILPPSTPCRHGSCAALLGSPRAAIAGASRISSQQWPHRWVVLVVRSSKALRAGAASRARYSWPDSVR